MEEQAIGTKVVLATADGQVTLPIEFREALGIEENTALSVALTGDGALIVRPLRVSAKGAPEGSPWLKELYELFAPVRQRIVDLGMDDAEIDELIDQAVGEVRARRSATAVAENKGDYR